jgi:aminopeptidase-like protein
MFVCFSMAWSHEGYKSLISYTNIFHFDIDSDKKLVLDAHEAWENKHMTARLLGQEGNRHHSLWCPPAVNIARLNLLMKTSYGNVVRYMLFVHDCDYNSFLTLLSNYWMMLSMISRIIQTEVNVICWNEAEADNIDRGLNNSWYHAKAESNFIIYTFKDMRNV